MIQHASIDLSCFDQVIETCAGIGAVSAAKPFCQARTSVYVDHHETLCQWLEQKGETPVVHGDVGDPFVTKMVSRDTGGTPQPLSGGFACQPFSALGDRREHKDACSSVLPSMLKMAFHVKAPLITLECTKEAKDSAWVQQQLLTQTVLHVHTTWPTFRTRWCACLYHPKLGNLQIPPVPQHQFCPAIMHLMQLHPHVSPHEQQQLDWTWNS